MNFILKFVFFFVGLFVKMFSYTLLLFFLFFLGIILFIYINFGDEITIIIEKLHETIPQAIAI